MRFSPCANNSPALDANTHREWSLYDVFARIYIEYPTLGIFVTALNLKCRNAMKTEAFVLTTADSSAYITREYIKNWKCMAEKRNNR